MNLYMAILLARLQKSDMMKHMALFGATGSGKTTLIENIFVQLTADKKASVILLEPAGDFSLRAGLLRSIPKEKLVFVSTVINRLAGIKDEPYTFTFNPFENDGTSAMKERLRHELTAVFTELLDSSANSSQFGITVNMASMLSNAIAVTLASPAPNIVTLKRLFTPNNADLLEIGKTFPHPEVQQYFLHVFESDNARATRSAILSKLSYFLSSETLYAILAASKSSFSLENCIEESKIIVVHTPVGSSAFVQSMLGRLIIARTLAHCQTREALPIQQRRPLYMILEELQQYSTASISTILQTSRKFSLGLVVSTQSWKQIQDRHLIASLQTNTLWKGSGVVDAANAAELARHLQSTTEEIQNLKPMQFIMKKMGNTPPFIITTKRLPDAMFYNAKEARELYCYLIKTGLYVKVSDVLQSVPLPPPPPTVPVPKKPVKHKQAKDEEENPFNSTPPF